MDHQIDANVENNIGEPQPELTVPPGDPSINTLAMPDAQAGGVSAMKTVAPTHTEEASCPGSPDGDEEEKLKSGVVSVEDGNLDAGNVEQGDCEKEEKVLCVGDTSIAENGRASDSKADEVEHVGDVAMEHGGDVVMDHADPEMGSEQVEEYRKSFVFDSRFDEGDDSGTEEEQAAFMRELETFHKEKSLEFKPPKFYGEGLNCLKLWRAVTRLGGYDQVTSSKLWRQVGESFKPPKTCTTVSWSFRCFYEKALLEYEKHKIRTGELQFALPTLVEAMPSDNQLGSSQGSGRVRRDAAAKAMQVWNSQRLLGNGEVGDSMIKDRSPASLLKRDKAIKNNGLFKRKKTSSIENSGKLARTKMDDTQTPSMVVDVGPPADWVKINVRSTKDCFEVYTLVPGLLREEVHVQSDPAGRLVISGEPEQPDNPWGVTPFKKVVTLPSRIDPYQTSAVVTLHGQLFVRAPFEQSEV